MNQQDTNNQSIIIEDLNAQDSEDIKGGPKKIFIGGLSVAETAPTSQAAGSSGLSAGKVSYSDLH